MIQTFIPLIYVIAIYHSNALSSIIKQIKQSMNPELHYLEHVQNTSICKQTHRFTRAQRFKSSATMQTDFKYTPSLPSKNRSCGFGYGSRVDFSKHTTAAPGPNTYNLSKFPASKRATSLGLSRQNVIFGTIKSQIDVKAKLPPPGAYQLSSSLKSNNFTLKQRLPDDIQINLRKGTPGPGKYEAICINGQGKYPTSKFKNTRFVMVDGMRNAPQQKVSLVGPGSYDLFNSDSKYSTSKISILRRTKVRSFGTAKRRGPQERHRLFVPAPGFYSTFSSFDSSYINQHKRFKTQE